MNVIELGELDDEEQRILRHMASGMGKTVEALTGEYLGELARRQNGIRRRAVVATVTDLALIRASKRPWKVTNS